MGRICIDNRHRGSLTEIVQIIGRVTRDSDNKTHAQFTNLIAKPDAEDDDVTVAVNTILKAVTASLLMEQVMAPELKLKSGGNGTRKKGPSAIVDGTENDGPSIYVGGLREPSTPRTRDIIENDLPDLKAAILQDSDVQKAIAANVKPEIINKELIPKVILQQNPDLNDEELEDVRQYVVAEMNLKQAKKEETIDESGNSKQFIRLADKFINVDDLDINLIDSINPFQRAYEIMSSNIDSKALRRIQQSIDATKAEFSDEELYVIYPKIKEWVLENHRTPSKDSNDEIEVRYAYALAKLRDLKARKKAQNGK